MYICTKCKLPIKTGYMLKQGSKSLPYHANCAPKSGKYDGGYFIENVWINNADES